MIKDFVKTTVLKKVNNGQGAIVNLAHDTVTDSYSIGLCTNNGVSWKYVSKKLHDLMVEELANQNDIV